MSKFGQYQLFDRIAVGGMAEIFRGRAAGEEGFEKQVAIKRILPAFARDGRFISMLVTEARIQSALTHRNIVQIHDLGVSEDGEYFIVLEYVDGHDLAALLTRLAERRARGSTPGLLSDAVALHIAIEVSEGIHYAHELRGADGQPLGLVHRDISPSNVLLSYAGEVKLSDFGLAKRRTDHSVVGSLKGKLTYMSPEQARRAPIDRRSDLFSVGAVLYELLTGEALRAAGDNVESWQRVASGLVPPVRRLRPDLAPGLEALLSRLLAPDPRDRFVDARALIDEARAVLEELPRSRVGETADIQGLLRTLLPPGTQRPPRPASRVIRLQSEILGTETMHTLGADLTVPGSKPQGLGIVDRSEVTSIASLEGLQASDAEAIAQAQVNVTPPAEPVGDVVEVDVDLANVVTPPPAVPAPATSPVAPVTPLATATGTVPLTSALPPRPARPPVLPTPPPPVPGAAKLEWPQELRAKSPGDAGAAGSTALPGHGPGPRDVKPRPAHARGESRRSAAGQIDVEDALPDNLPDPVAPPAGSDDRIIAAWPALLGMARATRATDDGDATPPLGSLGSVQPMPPYVPPVAQPAATPATADDAKADGDASAPAAEGRTPSARTPSVRTPGGSSVVKAPAPVTPPFPPAPSAPLSASALPPLEALPDPPARVSTGYETTSTSPYEAPQELLQAQARARAAQAAHQQREGAAGGDSGAAPDLDKPLAPPVPLVKDREDTPPLSDLVDAAVGAPSAAAGPMSPLPPPPPPVYLTPAAAPAPFLQTISPSSGSTNVERRRPGVSLAIAVSLPLLGLAILAGIVHLAVTPLQVLVVWRSPAPLSVQSTPSGATVLVDGRALPAPTPTSVAVTRDRVAHEVSVTLPGHVPASQSVRFDRSVSLEVSFALTPLPAEPAPPPPPAATADAGATAAAPPPSSEAPPPPASDPPPAAVPPLTAAAPETTKGVSKSSAVKPGRKKSRSRAKARHRRTIRNSAAPTAR